MQFQNMLHGVNFGSAKINQQTNNFKISANFLAVCYAKQNT